RHRTRRRRFLHARRHSRTRPPSRRTLPQLPRKHSPPQFRKSCPNLVPLRPRLLAAKLPPSQRRLPPAPSPLRCSTQRQTRLLRPPRLPRLNTLNPSTPRYAFPLRRGHFYGYGVDRALVGT